MYQELVNQRDPAVGNFTTSEALFMIDEYDGTIIRPTVRPEMKERIEDGLR